jgi:hypothetical protein
VQSVGVLCVRLFVRTTVNTGYGLCSWRNLTGLIAVHTFNLQYIHQLPLRPWRMVLQFGSHV